MIKKKQVRSIEKGIRLFFIYDSYHKDEKPLLEDCYMFPFDLAGEANHNALKDIVLKIVNECGLEYEFTEKEWKTIEQRAYLLSRRISQDEFIKKAKAKSPNIEIMGEYKNSRKKIPCKCKLCGFEWSPNADRLLSGIEMCPRCSRKHQKNTQEIH